VPHIAHTIDLSMKGDNTHVRRRRNKNRADRNLNYRCSGILVVALRTRVQSNRERFLELCNAVKTSTIETEWQARSSAMQATILAVNIQTLVASGARNNDPEVGVFVKHIKPLALSLTKTAEAATAVRKETDKVMSTIFYNKKDEAKLRAIQTRVNTLREQLKSDAFNVVFQESKVVGEKLRKARESSA
jgi:hypothetical protein